MKNYKEVAESVFRRSEEVIEQNKRRRRTLIMNGSAALCIVAAGAVWFGVWQSAGRGAEIAQPAGQFANDGSNYSVESDAVDDKHNNMINEPIIEPAPGASDSIIGTSVDVDPPVYPTFVESYPKVKSGAYDAPENGTVYYSDALKGALEEYVEQNEQEQYLFSVAADFYKDKVLVDVDSPEICGDEWNRLCGQGFKCEFRDCAGTSGTGNDRHFCMTLTREELESFAPAVGYGCRLSLYGECEGGCIRSHCNNSVCHLPTQSQSSHHAEHHSGHCEH